MDTYLIYIPLGLVLVILAIVIFFIIMNRKQAPKSLIDISKILELLEKTNINKVEYIRNKIVLSFEDVLMFRTEELLKNGAKGINIVGDKVKFFIEGSNEVNEGVYNSIKAFIEGK